MTLKNIAMNKLLLFIVAISIMASCVNKPKSQIEEKPEIISTTPFPNGVPLHIEFEKGKEFYYPLMVFWLEDTEGNYIETIYVAQSISTGTFRFGVAEGKNWKPGERRRPAALPYWGHKRGFKAPDGLYLPTPQKPLPDAITGATPKTSFILKTSVDPSYKKVRVLMEINQTWDWNQYWHNNRFPDDEEYKTSCQPALIYMAELDLDKPNETFELKPIGHSHPSGKTGELFTDLSTFTTAIDITKRVSVKLGSLE
jgi:hypothetical protein